MHIHIYPTTRQAGEDAARMIALDLNEAIDAKGSARLVLSTGASQFETIDALTRQAVDWSKVTMFHLDEYVDLPETHIASFRKYLKERFADRVPLKEAVYVNGNGDVQANIEALTRRLREAEIDVGVIGIGENGHIAFNDPPADLECDSAYKVVDLEERCKRQQVGEGWFASVDDVPKQAITMTVRQILACKKIVSVVPHAVKAEAVRNTLGRPVSPDVPAAILKTHPDWNLFLDAESAAGFCV